MNKKGVILARCFIFLMLAVMYAPIVILIIFSFSASSGIGAWSNYEFTFELYTQLFQDEAIMEAVANTLIIALASSLLATLIGTVSAVGIHYLHRKVKTVTLGVLNLTVVNADIITAVSYMLFFIVIMNYLDGFAALIIAHTMITIPFVVLSVLPRMTQINPNLYEAGRDLGAGPVRTLFTVILPQLVPGIISGFVMAFTLSLDDFVITLFNKGSGLETISTLIYSSTKHGIDPAFRALSSIMFLTVLAVLIGINIYAQKRRKKMALITGEKI